MQEHFFLGRVLELWDGFEDVVKTHSLMNDLLRSYISLLQSGLMAPKKLRFEGSLPQCITVRKRLGALQRGGRANIV